MTIVGRVSTKNSDLQKIWKVPPTHHFEMLKTDILEFRGKSISTWHVEFDVKNTSQVCTSEWTTDVSSIEINDMCKKNKKVFR